MVSVKLISFKEDTVLSDSGMGLHITRVPRSTDTFARDGRLLATEKQERYVLPILKFYEEFITDERLYNISNFTAGKTCEETYVAVDFESSKFLKDCFHYQVKKANENLVKEYESSLRIERDWVVSLENKVNTILKAPWYIRLKWLFTGVKVDG